MNYILKFQRLSCLILFVFISFNCASSRFYKPENWEEPLLTQASKKYMPSDIVKNPAKYKGEFIHWTGIVDTFYFREMADEIISDLVFEQKYYDYREDFSVQQEHMFVSPIGDGKFIMRKVLSKAGADSIKPFLNAIVSKKPFGFCYGNFIELKDSIPVLDGKGLRIIPEEYYATNLFSYEVARDSAGNVILLDNGFPALTNFKLLKVPGAGKND